MTIKTHITDSETGQTTRIIDGTEPNALVVATRELKTFYNDVSFFLNDVYGIDMNQNGGFGGTPIGIHNGTDTALWTGTNAVGVKVTFNSVDQNHTPAGTYSVKFNNVELNDVAQFAKGSSQSLTGYSAISLWIYVSKDWVNGDSVAIYGWDTGTGTIVGTPAYLENYFASNVYGVWHKVSISLSEMSLTGQTIDAFRIQTVGQSGKTPVFYVDDFQIEETGSPIVYTLKPNKSTWLYIDRLTYGLVDAFDGRLADSSMHNLPYNTLLGLSALSNGITFTEYLDGEITSSFTVHNLMDAIELPNGKVKDVGTDGTNTWMTLEFKFDYPIVLKSENDDKLTISISDDLTGLIRLRSYTSGRWEQRQIDGSSTI